MTADAPESQGPPPMPGRRRILICGPADEAIAEATWARDWSGGWLAIPTPRGPAEAPARPLPPPAVGSIGLKQLAGVFGGGGRRHAEDLVEE